MLNENIKVDIAIIPSTFSSDGTTSKYFSMKDYDWALFVWSVASQTILTTSTGTVYQALNGSAATSAAALASTTAIVTAQTKAVAFTITPLTLSAANSVTITSFNAAGVSNGAMTFAAVEGGSAGYSTAATAADREFSINDTAAGTGIVSTACTNLAAIINDTAYGVPSAYASASSTTVTVRALNAGDTVFTTTSNNTTNMTLSIDQTMGMIEVNSRAMTLSSNFTHLALNVVNNAALYTSAFCIRGKGSRHNHAQQAGKLTQLA